MKFKDLREQKEPKLIQEGTWQIPKTMKELQKLSEMLYVPYPAKTRRKVIQFQKSIPMGDDHMYDVLDDVGMTDERRLQKWDEPVYINVLAGKALEEEGWIKGRVTNNDRSYNLTHHGFSDLSELEEMTSLPRKKGRLKPLRKLLKLERVKGGKLDPLSKMGKSKLTGQEIARYYRDNPKAKQAARDKTVKKAIELALDLGGAQSYAIKEIEKLKRGLSKMPVVQQALRTANEEMTSTSSVAMPEIPLGRKHKVMKRKDLEESTELQEGQTYKSIIQGLEKDKKEVASKSKAFRQNDTKYIDKAINFLKMLEKEGIPAGQISQVDFVTNRVPKFFIGPANRSPSLSKFTPNDVKKAVAHAKKLGIIKEESELDEKNMSSGDMIKKLFKVRSEKEIDGIANLMNMTSLKVLQSMQKQNPKGFSRMAIKMGELPAMKESINEASMTYRIRKAQKPEIDNMMKGARMMKLKVTGNRVKTVGADPRRKTGDTEITVSGTAKNLRDFDAVVRGKSSYGDPSLIKEESATMKKVRQVVKKKGMMNIDGMKLDLTTASMIASVYDKVNPMNKKRMDKLKLPQLVNLTMKVAGKGKMKKEDAVERAKELADLKAKHKREVEQEKDEIAATKQTNESLWRNIHNKRKSGKKMRKPGEKGAPTAQDFKNARGEAVSEAQRSKKFQMTFTDKQPKSLDHFLRMIKTQEKATASSGIPTIKLLKKTKKGKNTVVDFMSGPNMQIKSINSIMKNVKKKFKEELEEAVSPAQQAAIAISKKERGEKPKNECADEKDFKPHMMYDPKTGKGVMAKKYADHVALGKKGYVHDDPKTKKVEENRAKRDAMRDMGTRKDRDDDGNPVATADDRKAADKNVVMQIRRVTDLSKPAQIELRNGKKVMLKPADAKMMMKKFDAIRKPQDRLKVQNAMNDKKMTVQGLKRLLRR